MQKHDPNARLNHPYRRPRDAATLIVVDRDGKKPRVLMGQRHMNSVFMPGMYVFPGGRVDRGDSKLAVPDRLDRTVEKKLLADMKGTPSPRRAKALALAAIREMAEETGLLVGSKVDDGWTTASPAWAPFVQHGVTPTLAPLTFFLRAITPPGRTRRFDTRFFCTTAGAIAHQVPNDSDELLNLHWLTFAEALKLELPTVTKIVLEFLDAKLAAGEFPKPADDIAYFYRKNGRFAREVL